jgi:hypothetical protein
MGFLSRRRPHSHVPSYVLDPLEREQSPHPTLAPSNHRSKIVSERKRELLSILSTRTRDVPLPIPVIFIVSAVKGNKDVGKGR